MSQFYFLPPKYIEDEHGALGECISGVLYLIKARGSRPNDAFTALSIFDRLFNGLGQGGESVDAWEVSRWKHRNLVEIENVSGDFNENDFIVWVDESSYFKPNWRVYEESEFKRVFVECCRNFIVENPAFLEDVSDALAANGMNVDCAWG